MEEIWKPVVGYEGFYEVSNIGRVKSLNREEKWGEYVRARQGKILKPGRSGIWYLTAVLYKNGKKKTTKVHRMVATAFIPNPLGKKYINHIDSNPINNSVKNLEWCTHLENMQHAAKAGRTKCVGEKNPHAKLTDEQVIEMRLLYSKGVTPVTIRKTYNLSSITYTYQLLKGQYRKNIL